MITNIIRKDFSPPTLENTAISILSAMEDLKVSEIPIIDSDNIFLGLVKETDVLNMENLKHHIYILKNQIKNIFIFSDSHLFQSIQIMNKHKLSLIPIIDRDKSYLGYIKPIDIINKIGHLSYEDTTSIIIVIDKKDYNLYEISRLIQENHGTIISFFSYLQEHKIHLNLLIQCNNSKTIIHTLKRYNYDIIETFSRQLKPTNLDERFESFIKYLNT